MAYFSVVAKEFIPHGNYITVNGSEPVRVQNGYYKISNDHYTVVVHSANGQAWECEGSIQDYGTRTACMSIRLAQDKDGHIIGMQYAVYDMNNSEEFVARGTSRKLILTYPKAQESTSQFRSHDEEMAWLDDLEQAQTANVSDVEDTTPKTTTTSQKKGGTGWIIFGILCLLTALTNLDTIQIVISCGVLGIILLFVGIKKKIG